MKKALYTLLLLAFLPGAGQSQVPGFMGKKLQVGYNFTCMPLLSFAGEQTESFVGLAIRHDLMLSYCIGRRTEIFGMYCYANRKGIGSGGDYTYTDANSNQVVFIPDQKPFAYQASYIGGGFKFYTSRYIAPVGKYFRLHFRHLTFGVKDGLAGKIYEQSSQLTTSTILKSKTNKLSAINLGFGMGSHRVINDRLLFNWYSGVNFHFSSEWPDYAKSPVGSPDRVVFGNAMHSIRWAHMADFSIGFSYLLF